MIGKPLRIAQLAPVAMPVRPGEGDSIEQLVSLLTEELVRRGHEVTLFATGDSQTSARLRALYPRGYEHDGELWDWRLHETMHAAWALEHVTEFDVVHSHAYHFALPFGRFLTTPVVHTYHVEPTPEIVRAFARFHEARLVAVSRFQRRCFAAIDNVPVVYHGIDTNAFPFGPERGDYLLFLGRMIPDKGPIEAVRAARTVGMPLVLAGPGGDYVESEVEPLGDSRTVEFAGPVTVAERNQLLAGAAALLYPIVYPEPFGLVLVEAMACGTPVAAVGLGAVPELVEEGVTGYCADSAASFAAVVPAALALDRARVRAAAVARFDYRRMVDEYEALYRRLAEERSSEAA
jgi:glycosyltransferase involved in cell wall biosynthesis